MANTDLPVAGCTVAFATTSGGEYTALENLLSFVPPSLERNHYEVNYINELWTRRRKTTANATGFQVTVGYDAANTLIALLASNVTSDANLFCKVTYTAEDEEDPEVHQFECFTSKFGVKGGTSQDQLEADIDFEIDGAVVVL